MPGVPALDDHVDQFPSFGLGAAPHQRQRVRAKRFYALTVDFSTNIAAAGSATSSAKVDADADFVIENILLVVYPTAAVGASIAYTPLCYESSGLLANNTYQPLNTMRVDVSLNDNKMFRTPIRAHLMAGSGGRPHYALTKPMLKAGETAFVTLYNDGANAVQAQVVFEGYYLGR